MASEPAQSHAGDPRETSDDEQNDDEDSRPLSICHVCQRPISDESTRIEGGELAHPECAAKVRRDGPLL